MEKGEFSGNRRREGYDILEGGNLEVRVRAVG